MDSMAPNPLKPRVLALMAAGQATQQAFIAGLSDAQRAAPGIPDAWAAKDHVAHNAAWIAEAARVIAAAARGETPTPSPDETEFNPQVFAAQQHRSWEGVLADAAQAHAALQAALSACSEADLSDPARFPWRSGDPLWSEAFVSGYDHLLEHYEQFYLEAGEGARIIALREEAAETARRLIGETRLAGLVVYKLGGAYARIGQTDQALAALRESFARMPRLRAWSQEDATLETLWANPAFQALVADAAAGTAQH